MGLLLVPLVCFALSYGWYKKSYPVVDLILSKLKGRVRWGFQFTFLLVTLVLFTILMFCGSILETSHAYIDKLVLGGPGYYSPAWPWNLTMIIGFFLLLIRNVLDLITMVRTGQDIPDR